MSGFLGMLRQDGAVFDDHLLRRIVKQLRLRGSDAQNIFVGRELAACFTLLQVSQGRQATQQPVALEGRRYWLLGDIRLDRRQEFIADLVNAGMPPSENATDEELLLRAWKLWGETTLQRVLRDFSFAICDEGKKTL